MTPSGSDPLGSIASVAPGRWSTVAGEEWSNPGGGLWGGYAIGLAIRAVESERDVVGEALSLTVTYAAALPSGALEVRTRRLRQGGSVGVWEVEILPAGSGQVGVHAIVTMARRPKTPPFAFATMPAAPDPETLPTLEMPGLERRYGASAFERRVVEGYPPEPGESSRSLAWVRSRDCPMDKALLGMVTDHSPPRAFYALGRSVRTTTLSLTAYLHATAEEIAEIGNDFILVECEGRVGNAGASDERSSYWSRRGKLLATSEQLAWYREVLDKPVG
jgi:acyl-coenzyme A thioesterase PaaI-like protein